MSRIALLAAVLLISGCSTAEPGTPTQVPTTAPPSPTAAPATPTAAPATMEPTMDATDAPTDAATDAPATVEPTMAAVPTVTLADAGHLVGPDGLSLYTFDVDEPDTSNCEGECLANWPALSVDDPASLSVGDGLDAASFGTITRSDGTLQVTFNQMPLYYFIGDSAPGDTNGDGVNDVWHLATAEAGSTTSPQDSPDAYNYYDEY